jgi:hypothetical protein
MHSVLFHFPDWKGDRLQILHVGLKKFHLRCAPHALSVNQKSVKFEASSDGSDGTQVD